MNWQRIRTELAFPFLRFRWLLLSATYTAIVYVVSLRAGLLDITNSYWILTAAVILLVSPLYHALLIPSMAAARFTQQEVPNAVADLGRAFPRLVIGEVLVNVLVISGAFLFLLPGIFFGIRFGYYKQLILLEDCVPVAAMRESFRRTVDVRLAFSLFVGLGASYGIAAGLDLLLLYWAPTWLLHTGSVAVSALLLLVANAFVTSTFCESMTRDRRDALA